jgi:hypothetical protein
VFLLPLLGILFASGGCGKDTPTQPSGGATVTFQVASIEASN